jgi:hypothetical protein
LPPKMPMKLQDIVNIYEAIFPWLKDFYNSHVIIKAFNTNSLQQHDQDINHDHNIQVTHVLCILGKKKYNCQMTYKNS